MVRTKHSYNNRQRRPSTQKYYHQDRRPYYPRRKRQAAASESVLTIAFVAIFAVIALAARASSDAVPVLVAGGIIFVAIVLAGLFFLALRKRSQLRAIEMSGVDTMDGFVFEKYVVELLKNEGFQSVTLTEKYDLGIDVIANKDGERWGIQVKRNRGKTKAISVRQAVTALNHYKCTRAMVVTNSMFTGAAKQLAESNNCVLIDRRILGQWIAAFRRSK